MVIIPKETVDRNQTWSISQMCRDFDVTPRTLRFYEQKEMLKPARKGWTRIFGYRDRARVKLILRGKRAGFPLDEIKEMLDLYNLRDGNRKQLELASVKMKERLIALKEQQVEVEEALVDLKKTVKVVDGMLKQKTSA